MQQARQHKSVVTTARILTSPITTTMETYRAASGFSTKLRAAVSFGTFRFSAPPPPPETAGYMSDSPRAGEHSTPVVAIARARPRDFCFGASDPQSRAVTRKAEPRDPPNAECTGINWTFTGGYNHLTFTANMRAVVFVFVVLSWRRRLCAKKSRRGTTIENKMIGGRRRRERGAGGRARCVWWSRRERCDCAALKSPRAGSRQKVPRRALRKKPRSDFFSCFLNENELEIRN